MVLREAPTGNMHVFYTGSKDSHNTELLLKKDNIESLMFNRFAPIKYYVKLLIFELHTDPQDVLTFVF